MRKLLTAVDVFELLFCVDVYSNCDDQCVKWLDWFEPIFFEICLDNYFMDCKLVFLKWLVCSSVDV